MHVDVICTDKKAVVRGKHCNKNCNLVDATGVDIMKKEQEAAQQKADSAGHVGNHVASHAGSSNPPSHVVQNHVPHHAQEKSGSRSLLAKVGLSVGSESGSRSSVIGPALANAGVDSAVVGGGQATTAVRKVPKGGVGGGDAVTRTSNTDQTDIEPPMVEERAPAGLTQLPPSMTSPSTTTTTPKKKEAGGGGRRGGGSGDTPRLSQLLTPRVIDDHFDQYIAGRQPPTSASSRPSVGGGGGGSDFPAFSYDNRPTTSNEPASTRDSRSRALQRRKTLPGRPAGPLLLVAGTSSNPGHRAPAPTLTGNRENEAISFVAVAAAATATAASAVPVYRKPAAAAAPPPSRPSAVGGSGARLRKAASGNRGSMPDVSECASVAATAASPSMPREEVHVLSQLRREELRRLREEAARRNQQDIVLRLGDIKVLTAR